MVTRIPNREEYYFDGTCFKVKSKIAKRIRTLLLVMLFTASLIPVSASFNNPKGLGLIKMDYPTEISGLHSYISAKFETKKETLAVVSAISKWSEEFKLEPALVAAVIEVESTFNVHAISPAGAMGLMQVLPRWHTDKIIKARNTVGSPEVFNVNTNIYLGSWILSDCIKQFRGVEKALRCYNGSIGLDTNYDTKVLATYRKIQAFIKKEET